MNKRKIEDLTRFNNFGLPLERAENNWVFYIVSLDRLIQRRKTIIEYLLPFVGKVPIFLFDAIDWKDYSLEDLNSEGYDIYKKWKLEGSYENWFSRELKLGEVAACAGHYNVWKHIQSNGFKYSLILEDDSNFVLEKFIEGLNLADDFLENNNCDIFYLSSNPNWVNKRVSPTIEQCGYEYNTHAYAVTQMAVNELVSSGIKENLIPADEFLTSTFCEHPREDIRNLYNNKRLIAHKLHCKSGDPAEYVRQGSAEDLEHSDIIQSDKIK